MSNFSRGLAKGEDGGRRVALKWGAPPTELCLERPFRVVHVYLSCEWIWGQAMRGHGSHWKGGHRRNPVWKKLLALGYRNGVHARRGTISWSREGGVGLVSCFSNRDRRSRGGVGKFFILITSVVIIAVLLPVFSLFLSCGICDRRRTCIADFKLAVYLREDGLAGGFVHDCMVSLVTISCRTFRFGPNEGKPWSSR